MKPLIGINLDIKKGPPQEAAIQTTYTDAILKSGGVPLLLAPMPEADLALVMQKLDGIMLIGGADYCPTLYNEEPDSTVELAEPRRQEFDLACARLALADADMPVLGICLGCQLINILQGGSLVQDIKSSFPDSDVEHSSKDGWKNGFTMHDVKVLPESKLGAVLGRYELPVSTSHHQSVKQVGKGLKIVAHADDGIVEAVEMSERAFVLGVQWHPERDYETNKPLFDGLVAAALNRRRGTL